MRKKYEQHLRSTLAKLIRYFADRLHGENGERDHGSEECLERVAFWARQPILTVASEIENYREHYLK